MKNKRLLAIIAAMTIAAQGAAISSADALTLSVNGSKVEAEVIVSEEIKMLPLRALAETIGYNVSWDASQGMVTLAKEGDELFVKPNAARTADYMAKIHNDRTYVTLDFLKVSMDLDYVEDEKGNINVLTESEEASLIRKVTVNSVSDSEISVNDEIIGEVILKISDETKITKGGEKASISDITAESILMVEYSPAMTMSIPAQTLAVSIEILAEEENVLYEGTISEITEDGMVIVKSEKDPYGVALKITENTQISHVMNRRLYKAEDLEVGMKIEATHSNVMTRSLPPQTEAISIVIK